MTAILYGVVVAAAWLGAVAFMRLPDGLSRIHVVAFINVVAGAALTAASAVTEGLSGRTLKIALIWLVTLATSALLSHLTARALHLRDGAK